jgi:hypothetical protein
MNYEDFKNIIDELYKSKAKSKIYGNFGSAYTMSYQTPERDEQGTFYGYKALRRHCDHPECECLISPRYMVAWDENGELEADREPSEHTSHGIHFTKAFDNSELRNYFYPDSVLVKCALSGTVIETEQGFRAQHAQIIGVLIDGNWKSYQDYKECAKSHFYTNPFENDRKEIKWEYRKTHWKPGDSYFNATADS